MFANIFADKSDNFFLDPWRYIRRHDICNTGLLLTGVYLRSLNGKIIDWYPLLELTLVGFTIGHGIIQAHV